MFNTAHCASALPQASRIVIGGMWDSRLVAAKQRLAWATAAQEYTQVHCAGATATAVTAAMDSAWRGARQASAILQNRAVCPERVMCAQMQEDADLALQQQRWQTAIDAMHCMLNVRHVLSSAEQRDALDARMLNSLQDSYRQRIRIVPARVEKAYLRMEETVPGSPASSYSHAAYVITVRHAGRHEESGRSGDDYANEHIGHVGATHTITGAQCALWPYLRKFPCGQRMAITPALLSIHFF